MKLGSITTYYNILIFVLGIVDKQTNNNDLLEKYGGTKNCIYKD